MMNKSQPTLEAFERGIATRDGAKLRPKVTTLFIFQAKFAQHFGEVLSLEISL